MSRSVFGWDLPPGCTTQHIEDAMGTEAPCECCGKLPDDCICPACPKCGEVANMVCYADNPNTRHDDPGHGMRFSTDQLIGQTQRKISDLQEQIHDHQLYIEWLIEDAEGRKHR